MIGFYIFMIWFYIFMVWFSVFMIWFYIFMFGFYIFMFGFSVFMFGFSVFMFGFSVFMSLIFETMNSIGKNSYRVYVILSISIVVQHMHYWILHKFVLCTIFARKYIIFVSVYRVWEHFQQESKLGKTHDKTQEIQENGKGELVNNPL